MPTPEQHSGDRRPPRRTLLKNFLFVLVLVPLAGGLLLQGVLLVRGSWEVPDFLLDRLHAELRKEGWSATYTSLAVRPPGTVVATDLRLTRLGEEQPLATSARASVEFDLIRLIQAGELVIKKFGLQDGRIYCPVQLSPTGVHEELWRSTHVAGRRLESAWEIESLSGRMRNLTFTASGILPDLPARDGTPLNLHQILNTLLPRLVRERNLLESAVRPHIRLRLKRSDVALVEAMAEIFAESFQAGHGLSVEEPYLAGRWSYDGVSWKTDEVWAEAAAAGLLEARSHATSIRGRLFWEYEAPVVYPLLPNRGELFFSRLETPLVELDEARVEGLLTGRTEAVADVFTLLADGTAHASARVDWEKGDAAADLWLRANPNAILQRREIRTLGLNRDVYFHQAPAARGTAEVRDWELVRAEANVQARQVEVDGVALDRAWVRARIEGEEIVVPEMILAYDDFEVEGSFSRSLREKDYRLFFKGGFRPLHISPWFGEWWEDLWGEFDFAAGPLRGDVDISGALGDPDRTSVSGSVEADRFFLRGVPFRKAGGTLHVLDNYVDFHEAVLVRDEGVARGEFQYYGDPGSSRFQRLTFAADSTLNPVDVAPVFGRRGGGVVGAFRFKSPPVLNLKGTVFGAEAFDATRVAIAAQSTGGLTFEGIPLDRLQFKALIAGDELKLDNLEFTVGGGTGSGYARKWTEEETEKLQFDISVSQLDLEKAFDVFDAWRGADAEPEGSLNRFRGRMTFAVAATGDYGDPHSFTGGGNLQIRKADLAEVHLLGLLSRVLSVTPLGFTSLQFSSAESTFAIERERIHFPNLRLSGPTSALQATGDYRLPDQSLDFSVKLLLLKESSIPLISVILSPLLEPLAQITEVRLSGPASDPQWRFLLGPRNILGVGEPSFPGTDTLEEEEAPEGSGVQEEKTTEL